MAELTIMLCCMLWLWCLPSKPLHEVLALLSLNPQGFEVQALSKVGFIKYQAISRVLRCI